MRTGSRYGAGEVRCARTAQDRCRPPAGLSSDGGADDAGRGAYSCWFRLLLVLAALRVNLGDTVLQVKCWERHPGGEISHSLALAGSKLINDRSWWGAELASWPRFRPVRAHSGHSGASANFPRVDTGRCIVLELPGGSPQSPSGNPGTLEADAPLPEWPSQVVLATLLTCGATSNGFNGCGYERPADSTERQSPEM